MPINLISFLFFFFWEKVFLWSQTQGDPPALVFHILGLQKCTTLHSFQHVFKSALKLSSPESFLWVYVSEVIHKYTCIQKPEVMSVFLSYLYLMSETGCLTEPRAHGSSVWLASKPRGLDVSCFPVWSGRHTSHVPFLWECCECKSRSSCLGSKCSIYWASLRPRTTLLRYSQSHGKGKEHRIFPSPQIPNQWI